MEQFEGDARSEPAVFHHLWRQHSDHELRLYVRELRIVKYRMKSEPRDRSTVP